MEFILEGAILFGKEYNSQYAYSQGIEYENLDGF